LSIDWRGIYYDTGARENPSDIVEILSPSNAYYDLREKFRTYEKYGVKEYWIVDPEEKSVEVFVLTEGKYCLAARVEQQGVVTSALLSGFVVEVEKIFAGI
jgi:Uma2 family endonuclease